LLRIRGFLAFTLLCAGGCMPAPQQFQGPTMGTTYSVTVTRLPEGVKRDTLQAVIDGVLSEVTRHLSTYDPASEISAFNTSRSTAALAASPMLHEVVALSRVASAASAGAFDITVAPLVRAWGFGDGQGASAAVPQREQLERMRASVGYEKLILPAAGRSLQKSVAELEIDVAGVAPGYAVDLIAQRFEALGVRDYLVELGGEVRARGRSPAGRPWRVAVEAPVGGEPRPYALAELDRMSASTSGDYRDFRLIGGRRYSHTIDPRTGEPVHHQLASVCVLHPSAAYADAYATALMVLGPKQGYELATHLGLAALLIEHDAAGAGFHELVTPQFERLRRPLD
jgi:FAD:protein FMN transferase